MTASIQSWEKLLPNQAFNSDQYSRDVPIEQALYETILWTSGVVGPQAKFKIEQTGMFTIEQMASNAAALGFITWLLKVMGARTLLEIGTFVGVSGMYFADALGPAGRVVTIEKFDHFAAIARRNFEANGLADRIELVEGDAHEILAGLGDRGPFDFAFIDGNKERYADYFRLIEPMMSSRGIIAVDDAVFHGDALSDNPKTEKGRGVREMLAISAGADGWHRILLPLSNGLLLMQRK